MLTEQLTSTYTSPHNGEPLVPDAPNLLGDGELLWPVIDGIAYLRPRHDLREQAVALLQSGKETRGTHRTTARPGPFRAASSA